MKKALLIAAVATLALSSCSTVTNTATTETVNTEIYNRSNADLNVADNTVSYTLKPTASQRRAGLKGLKAAAVAQALEANGNAEVLVNPRFEIKKTNYFFFSRVKYVKVTGHPATYRNFHPTTQSEATVINALNDIRRKK